MGSFCFLGYLWLLGYNRNKKRGKDMHAIVIGATGATGKDLLERLLEDDDFHQVDIFVRRDIGFIHKKCNVHVIDFDRPDQWKQLVKGDVLFSCIGTTRKIAGSKEAQWKVDYDYQYQFAVIAKENNVQQFILVSSDFSSSRSNMFYSKMKGQLEEAIKALAFGKLVIFQPPVLIRKNSDRIGEAVSVKFTQFLNKLGLFHLYRPLPTEILAQAMANAAKAKGDRIIVIKRKAIWGYAGVSH
jgi:uncharacterized protein YbjT (DUF2867 family)